MDKKSKILLFVFIVALIVSIILTYYRTIMTRNFTVIQSETAASEN